jgi:hypothetical protein
MEEGEFMSTRQTDRRGTVELAFWRRQWLKLVASMEDPPRIILSVGGVFAVLVWVYGVPMKGLGHGVESFRRWKLEMVGGEYSIDRAIRIFDVLMSFEPEPHDRLDVVVVGGVPVAASAFREELETVAARRRGRVRFVILDPRAGEPGSPMASAFDAMAVELGQEPWEFRVGAWHAAAAVLRLREKLGDNFEIRLLSAPAPDAEAPFFVGARWVNAYDAVDPTERMDVVAYGTSGRSGEDYANKPATLYVDRPDNPVVKALQSRFSALWNQATPLEEAERDDLMETLQSSWREY